MDAFDPSPSGPFAAGTPVVLRSVFEDHVGAVIPSVVVTDDVDHVALYQPAGTTLVTRTGRRGGPHGRNMYPGGWDGGHEEAPWRGAGVLRVHRWGQPWSVWRWRDPAGWRPGCYVNLDNRGSAPETGSTPGTGSWISSSTGPAARPGRTPTNWTGASRSVP